MVPEKRRTYFFKGYHKEHILKIIKEKFIMLLSWSSWNSNNDIFLKYFPRPKLGQYQSFYIYMKWKLDYSIFVLHVHFFLDSLESQVNQENIYPTLTILNVTLVLKKGFFRVATQYEQQKFQIKLIYFYKFLPWCFI